GGDPADGNDIDARYSMNRSSSMRITYSLFIIVALAVAAPWLIAQENAEPLPADQMLDRMLQPGQGERAIQPTEPDAAVDRTSGSGAPAPGAPQVTVLREGSYIVDRLGRLTPSPDGQQMEFT